MGQIAKQSVKNNHEWRIIDMSNAIKAGRLAPIKTEKRKDFSTASYTFKRWLEMFSLMGINSENDFYSLFDIEGMEKIYDETDLWLETDHKLMHVIIHFPDTSFMELSPPCDLFFDIEAFASMDI